MKEDEAIEAMFLFGKPSVLVNDFIYLLYQENQKMNGSVPPPAKLKMMTSILELTNKPNEIYITISEEPDSQDVFLDNLNRLITLMRNIIYNNTELNQNGNKLGDKIVLLDCHKYIINNLNKTEKINYRGPREKINTPETIKSLKKINIIYNKTYIKDRRNGYSYEPFYKTDTVNGENVVACNSGSICSESKIFSYLHKNNLEDKIKGMVAYWIGNNLTPAPDTICKSAADCQYHPNYCYNHNIPEDNEKLDYIIQHMETNELISEELSSQTIHPLPDVFRGYALPCPGCTLNYERLMKDIKTNWDINQCTERDPRFLSLRRSKRKQIYKLMNDM